MKKAQGLSMTTVVVMILVLLTIAALVFFIFSAAEESAEGRGNLTKTGDPSIAKCKSWAGGFSQYTNCYNCPDDIKCDAQKRGIADAQPGQPCAPSTCP